MLRLTAKAGIAGGTVYLVSNQGVWKDSETTSKLYDSIKKETCPYVKEAASQLPFDLPQVPQVDNMMQMGVHYWNCGVRTTFTFLLNSPTHVKDWSKSAYESIESFINSPEVSEK
ncbi:MICOS complex subunit MIC13 homolog QIL1-like [Arctopsyche grandis]|uniref:MICOS complex subunit MIC13 homolog QIL1-like n=1 Tax=Arctopsyche grandis TaxID=121162 RepID=UPI00406DA27E